MEGSCENYLRDLGYLIKELATEARAEYLSSSEENESHRLGYLMAFHRVVTLMQQQAEAFNMPLEKLCLEGIPEEFFFVSKGSNNSFKADSKPLRGSERP